MPDTSGPAAQLGTHAHDLAEQEIMAEFATPTRAEEHRARAAAILDDPFKLFGEDQIVKNSRVYSKFVRDFVNDFRPTDIDWNVEGRFELWYEPGSHGTADFWAVDKQLKRLYILDYKSGRIPVKSDQNPQLAIYAIAAYDQLKKFNDIEEVYAGISQPMYSHEVEWWEFNLEQLEHMRAQIDRTVREIDNPLFSPRYEPSEKACQWCYHAASCPARAEALDRDCAPKLDLEELTPSQVLGIHKNAKLHKDFLSKIEEAVREMGADTLSKGGLKMVRGSKRLRWNPKADVAKALAKTGVALYTEPTLRTPAAIRDDIGDNGALLDQLGLIEEFFNKPSIVPVDDRREALAEEGAE